MRGGLWCVLLLVAAAGCAQETTQAPAEGTTAPTSQAPPVQVPDEPAPPQRLEQSGCRQLHLFLPTPWSMWSGGMPEGFGPDGTDPTGQTTTLYQHVSQCTMNGTAVAEVWSAVSVTPPDALASPAVLHLVPDHWVTDSPGLLAAYRAWGLDGVAELGTVEWTEEVAPALRRSVVTTQTENATYTFQTEVPPLPTGSAAGTDRVFVVRDGAVTGWFDYAWPGWTDLGLGVLVESAQGDPEAPPAYPGDAHQVEDVEILVQFQAWPADG